MKIYFYIKLGFIFICFSIFMSSCNTDNSNHQKLNKYQDLIDVFKDFKIVQQPIIINEVPDYSSQTMSNQKSLLDNLQNRLNSIDTIGWSNTQRIEYHLVKAEMHGLEFYHEVLRPWSRDPGFYLQTQAEYSCVPLQ